MRVKLTDTASVIRSKNAGPFELTLDIIFKDDRWYRRVKEAKTFNRSLVSRLYNIPEQDILDIIEFDPAGAIKITLKRRLASGDVGETDVYGAQQHAPLLELEIELPD